ncbi:HK97 gp10 family phage protein [Pseudomonas sp. CDFA 602]|uniref:HK97-gp10 family putative phage morphogenesis protein n=1 Tax=Pseudomonas californiensis TaxID=2829823 RepID=UPI001E5AA01C|nr:HK97-gp10 family putative phage morphogenesis protein [Pseudomonas californiensis]MCD5996505.1 HK97 gp10 family phage protein [Pseudomonas californiensis]MCD6002104.1 HK97 gp10 family phage protein [Pseudomonas californiensis]
MARRSSVQGDFKLRGVLRRIGNQMESDLRPAMVQAATLVLATQQGLIPRDTGDVEGALEAFVSKSGLDAQIGIRGKKDNRTFFYGRFLEYGTKAYKRGDGVVAARPAHPWLRPSYDLNRDQIIDLISRAIASTLRKAAEAK